MNPSANDRLLAALRLLSSTEAQNRLMRIADRELAVSMMFMQSPDRERLLGLLSPKKAALVREEFGFQKHLAVRHDQYQRTIENVIRQLKHGSSSPIRSYLRPRNRRG